MRQNIGNPARHIVATGLIKAQSKNGTIRIKTRPVILKTVTLPSETHQNVLVTVLLGFTKLAENVLNWFAYQDSTLFPLSNTTKHHEHRLIYHDKFGCYKTPFVSIF